MESGVPTRPGMQANSGVNFDSLGVDSLAGNVAMNYMSNVASQFDVNSKISSMVHTHGLRMYFAVDHEYVLKKLKLVLLPFLHKESWDRQRDDQEVRLPPSEDVMAPDLYIPTMAFVTYIIAIGVAAAVQGKFDPEILSRTATFGMLLIGVETALLKGAVKYCQGREATWLDLLALASYKYVGVAISTIVNLFLSYVYGAGLIASVLLGLSMAYFMRQSLRPILLRSDHETGGDRQMKKYIVLGLAFAQVVLLVVMS